MIAELTFYFWKRLYGLEYEQTLRRTTLKRTEVAVQLERIYQARNRLAHHEPVLYQRFEETVRAIEFLMQRLGMCGPDPASLPATLVAEDLTAVRVKATALHAQLDALRVGQP